MVDWSPDKTKKCEKCKNWEKFVMGEDTPLGRGESSGNHCSFLDCSSDDICLDIIYKMISSLEDYRQDDFANGIYDSPINVVLANICPLYKEKKEKSESFECTGGLCEYYHEVCGCDLNNNTKDCALIREEKGIPKVD